MKYKKIMALVLVCQSLLSFRAFGGVIWWDQKDFKRWENSIVSLKMYEDVVNQKNCNKSAQAFAGCIFSLQFLINFSSGYTTYELVADVDVAGGGKQTKQNGVYALIPQLIVGYKGSGKKLLDLGTFNLEESNSSSLLDIEEVASPPQTIKQTACKSASDEKLAPTHLSDIMAKNRALIQSLYSNTIAKNPQAIDILMSYLKEKSKTTVVPKAFIGKALNIYLSNAVDPHSSLVLEKSLMESMAPKGKELVGIGAEIIHDCQGVRIRGTVEGSGSKAADLKRGDVITHIADEPVVDMTLSEAVGKLRGEPNSIARLKILRDNKIIEKSVVRGKVNFPNFKSELFTHKDLQFGYAKLEKFKNLKDCQDLKAVFTSFQENTAGALLDLRGNAGGSTEVAVCIAGIFLGSGHPVVRYKNVSVEYFPEAVMKKFIVSPTTISKDDLDGSDELLEDGTVVSFTRPSMLIYTKPLVVLVDKDSASSSELVAAALRDRNRAVIVGRDTFGKGTSMDRRATSPEDVIKDAKNAIDSIPESRLMILGTSRRFYSPNGKTHHGDGIKVQIPSYVGLEPTTAETVNTRENVQYLFPLPFEELKLSEQEEVIANLFDRAPQLECIEAANLKKIYLEKSDSDSQKDMQILTGLQQMVCAIEAMNQEAEQNTPQGNEQKK